MNTESPIYVYLNMSHRMWSPQPFDSNSPEYIRLNEVPQWIPIKHVPEEWKDGRDLLMMVQGRMLVGFWGESYYKGSEIGWISNAEMSENPSDHYYILSPTHIMLQTLPGEEK